MSGADRALTDPSNTPHHHAQNVTLSLLEVRDSRCPVGTLCALTGKATAVIEVGPGTYI